MANRRCIIIFFPPNIYSLYLGIFPHRLRVERVFWQHNGKCHHDSTQCNILCLLLGQIRSAGVGLTGSSLVAKTRACLQGYRRVKREGAYDPSPSSCTEPISREKSFIFNQTNNLITSSSVTVKGGNECRKMRKPCWAASAEQSGTSVVHPAGSGQGDMSPHDG